jgi:hypothetical protein
VPTEKAVPVVVVKFQKATRRQLSFRDHPYGRRRLPLDVFRELHHELPLGIQRPSCGGSTALPAVRIRPCFDYDESITVP